MENIYTQEVDASNIVRYKSMKFLAIGSFVIAGLYLLIGQYTAGSVMALFGFFALYARKYSLIRYAYGISGDKISVERIVAGKERKKMFDFKISDIIIMAPERSEKIKELKINPDKTMAFHMKGLTTGVYTVLAKADGKVYKLKLAPDKRFIELCQKKNREKVIKE
ncbi:MAG: hypothetical protein H6Q58_1046 [Firmicutes bacterium]|nr:hypothetical protein [Bacillota bacterium]